MFRITRRSVVQQLAAATVSPLLFTGRARAQKPAADVPWLAEIQQPPAKAPTEAPVLSGLLRDARGQKITTLEAWKSRREELRRCWLDFLGPLPAERKQPPKLTVVEEDRTEGVVRQLVRYDAEPGLSTEAYLLKPLKVMAKAPGIAVFHSTVEYSIRQPAGLEGPPEKFFGLRYAKKGCVCFCPRNFLWPTTVRLTAQSEAQKFLERKPQSKGMAKMLYDSLVAVDILAAQP